MKPGLAVLPLEVWTDVFVCPWITRKKLAEIVHKFKDRKFAEKLQFVLHDYGKQSLRFLDIAFKPKDNACKYQLRKRKILEYEASLAAASQNYPPPDIYSGWLYERLTKPTFENCEFAETGMPMNVKNFKQLLIRFDIKFVDDQVLTFLDKVKSLFTNVFLDVERMSAKDMRILFGQLLPMIGGIRGISCASGCIRTLERHFPGTLALAKELNVEAELALIPSYLNWLNAPQVFDRHVPRLLVLFTDGGPKTITAIANAVRKQFLEALTPSAFVVYVYFFTEDGHHRAEELELENAVTKEQLVIINGVFQTPAQFGMDVVFGYVEILRHPIGGGAKMREWLKERAFFEKFKDVQQLCPSYDKEEQLIWIASPKFG